MAAEQINDLKYATVNLNDLAIPEEFYRWLGEPPRDGVGNSVTDRLFDALYTRMLAEGLPAMTIDDMWFHLLRNAGYTGALPDMLWQFWKNGGLPGFGLAPFFEIDNMSLGLRAGTLVNSSTTPKTFMDYQGNIINTEAGEIVIEGARRVDHSDGMDYGYNALGIQYFNTEADGLTLISPPPLMRHLPALTNLVYPSKTTTVSDYPVRSNVVDRVVSQNIFTHAVAVDVAGVSTWMYHTSFTVVGSTGYTVAVWMKMDDDTAPVVASSSSDTSGDIGLILGGESIDASAVTDSSVEKFGDIYCVMMTGVTIATPTVATNNGIVQYAGNSDKKFEVYSIGLLEGEHLYPVYIPTTTAAVSWTVDDHNITSTDNNFDDRGIILVRSTELDIKLLQGLITMNNVNRTGWMYTNALTTFSTTDGTLSTSVAVTHTAGDETVVALIYDGTGKQIMVSLNGAAFVSSLVNSYDGAYLNSGTISIGLQSFARQYGSIQFYHDGLEDMTLAEMKTWVEENALRVTDIT